jgi:hypothetical protein
MRNLLVLALLPICSAVGAQGIDLTNPGFESLSASGTVHGWAPADDSAGTIDATTDQPRSGVGSLAITLAEPGRAVVISDPMALEVGRLYRLSGWIRTEDVRADPAARYPTAVPACLTMASFPFTEHSPAVGGSRDWTRVEELFFATQPTDRVRLHLGLNGWSVGTAWFDDIRVEPVEDIHEAIPAETVRWAGRGFRYDDRGWIVLHVEGEPYERGWQMGALVPDEIVEYMRKLSVEQNPDDPEAGWRDLRFETDALFLRRFHDEYLEEMQGIADGATARGARWHDRELELLDVAVLNSVIDLGQLHDALEVTPTALTGESFLAPDDEMEIDPESHSCSSFVATSPATEGDEMVFGQIFMWGGYTGVHWNVLVDLVPSDGHRLVYHSFPGGIHSGADFYLNAAGIAIGETTVSQTPFEPDSRPQSSRIRRAAQYASSIEDVERLLWEDNNGMYTNDWPIADFETGEVAILLLGTHRKKLWRSTDEPAPFGTPGFLWANNNNRDPEVRKEYLAQPDDRPFDLMFSPWNRDVAFNEFYRDHAGAIDRQAAVDLWASSPINRAHACDGKITTRTMADQLMVLAHYGKTTLREKFPTRGWRAMPDRPGADPHLTHGWFTWSPIVVAEALQAARVTTPEPTSEPSLNTDEAADAFAVDGDLWRGTVLPETTAESWFVSGTARYWSLMDALGEDPADNAEQLASDLAGLSQRLAYLTAREGDMAAVDAHRAYNRYSPSEIPRIKGAFALHQLRLHLGTSSFLEVMRTVHDTFREQQATTDAILRTASDVAGRDVAPVVRPWLERTGVPELEFNASMREKKGRWRVEFDPVPVEGYPHLVTHVEIVTTEGRHLRRVTFGEPSEWTFEERPVELRVNSTWDVPATGPAYYTWRNLIDDFHDLAIVYGTAAQDEANHTLARRWQERVADAYIEILPPLFKDSEVDPDTAARHDLIVLGSAGDNTLLQRMAADLPVVLGDRSFGWRGRTYGAPSDGLILVVPNPWNEDRVAYLVIANSALQLYRMTQSYPRRLGSWGLFSGAEIVARGFHEPERFALSLEEEEPRRWDATSRGSDRRVR